MALPGTIRLEGKKALLTGAVEPWGSVIARALAEAGADVAVTGRDPDAIKAAVNAAVAAGTRGIAVEANPDQPEDVEQAVRQAVGELLGLHILVNCPGVGFARPLSQIDDEAWLRVIEHNLLAPMRWCRAVGPHMTGQKYGHVVNFVSVLAERGMANGTALSASHAALRGLTQSLALEWARSGVRVNAVGLGWYDLAEQPPEAQLKEKLVRFLPLRRKGRPVDVASLVVLLASDVSDFTTGQTIYVDGGGMAHA